LHVYVTIAVKLKLVELGQKRLIRAQNYYFQHRIKLIAGKSLTYESQNGVSWFVSYLVHSLHKTRNKSYTNKLEYIEH
jgi:hypothetical protein